MLIAKLAFGASVDSFNNHNFVFQAYNTNLGLPDNDIRNTLVLDDGSICILSSTTLSFFDGVRFTNYKYTSSDFPYYEYTGVINLEYDSSKRIIWISNRDKVWNFSLDKKSFNYDAKSDLSEFNLPNEGLSRIILDESSNYIVLMKSGKSFYCQTKNGTTKEISLGSYFDTKSTTTLKYYNGSIFFANVRGQIAEYKVDISSTLFHHSFENVLGKPSSRIECQITKSGDIWLMYDHNLFLIKNSTKEIVEYKGLKMSPNDIFTTISVNSKDNLWIGTARNGVSIIKQDESNKKEFNCYTLPYLTLKNGKTIKHHSDITKINVDSNDGVWISTISEGLLYWRKDIFNIGSIDSPASSNGVKAMLETDSGCILLGTVNGLFEYNPSNGKTSIPYQELKDELVISLYKDKSGRIWVGTFYNGVYCIEGNNVRQLKSRESDATDNSYRLKQPNLNCVRCIYEDNQGSFWIIVYGGAGRLNPDTGEISLLRNTHPEVGHHMIGRSLNQLGDSIIVTGDNGVYSYSLSTGNILKNQIPLLDEIKVNNILKDGRDLLWFATSNGLYCLNSSSQWSKITNSNVQGICLDKYENVWISSGNSVCRIRPISENGEWDYAITEFLERDGVVAGPFFQNSILEHSNGNIYIGGSHGVTELNPSHLMQDNVNAKPKVTSISINGQSRDLAKNYTLTYDKNTLCFYFSNMNFSNPTHVSYKYQLENFDADWIDLPSHNRPEVTYTNLPHGNYSFHIKAANNSIDWVESDTINITIRPPFWKSTTAYLFYILLAMSAIWVLFYIILRSEHKKHIEEQRKREQEKKEELDQMKFRFFTNISHELRTPLSLILLPLESVIKEASGNSTILEKLEIVRLNVNHLLSLVNHLLDFRKLEMGGEKLKLSSGDIIEFVESSIHSFSDAASSKKISLNFENTLINGMMAFDKMQMSKIINNLLSNALKFTPSGGFISLSLSPGELNGRNALLLEVSDSGVGIPQDEIDEIFNRFYQCATNRKGGTGIGLNIVKQYVNMHQGIVSVTSEPNKGSTFSLLIPMDLKEESEAQEIINHNSITEKTKSAANNAEKKIKIMLVDDNAEFREYLSSELSNNYEVIQSKDGASCLNKINSVLPDLLISDVMMPNVDGFELTRRLKTDVNTSHIPIILLTARASEDIRQEGYESGADAYLTKPFNMGILEARIKNLLEERSRRHKKVVKATEIKPSDVSITSIDEAFMKKIMQVVEDNLDNPEFSVEMMSEMICMQRMTLYRKIQSLLGMTPLEFIRTVRLKRAAQIILKDPKLTVSEVSDMVGFNTPKYFTKYFKEMYGCRPTEYKG